MNNITSINSFGVRSASSNNIRFYQNVVNSEYYSGFYFLDSDQSYIFNNNISSSGNGISLESTDESTILNNSIYTNEYGIMLSGCNFNNISYNNISVFGNLTYGVYIQGTTADNNISANHINKLSSKSQGIYIAKESTMNYIDSLNTIDGVPVYFANSIYSNCPDNSEIDASAYSWIGLIGCIGINITGSMSHTLDHIHLEVNDVNVRNVNISNSINGIYVHDSLNVSISDSFFNVSKPILFDSSTDMDITNNTLISFEGQGINLYSNINDFRIINNTISLMDGDAGIIGSGISNGLISNNNISVSVELGSMNNEGIELSNVDLVNITNNIVNSSSYSLYLNGNPVSNLLINNNEFISRDNYVIYIFDIISSNIINNTFISEENSYYEVLRFEISMTESYDINFSNNVIINGGYGNLFFSQGGYNWVIQNNSFNSNLYNGAGGIIINNLYTGINFTITNNDITTDCEGIYLYYIHDSNISFNNINTNSSTCGNGGIYLDSSNSNHLEGNNVTSLFSNGIYLYGNNNDLISNNLSSHAPDKYGLYVAGGTFGYIYNNIFNGSQSVSSTSDVNYWNTTNQTGPNILGGPNIGGNAYLTPTGDGFSQICNDTNFDGFCDEIYDILSDGSNVDYLPLKLYVTASDTTPPSVQILSPSNNTWHKTNVTISFIAIDDMSTIINCTFYDNNDNKGTMNVTNNTLTNVSPILTNAKHDIYLNCTDQVGNLNISNLITIYFDNIAPEVSFTLSSTVVYVGDTLTYNCTATDNSESYGGSVTTNVTGIDTSSAGTKTARCTATDTAGNSYYVERTYTVNQVYVPPTGGGGGTSCSPIWQCSEWSECSKDGIRTRTCIDINNCGTTTDKPPEIAACIYACMPDWKCSAWTECSPQGLQIRTCVDNNNCGFISPSTSRSCLYIPKQLTADADQADVNSISAIQSNFVNLFQSLENNNYEEVESYFSSAIDQTNFLLKTSPTINNLNISLIVIDNGLKLSDLLIQQEQFSSSSNILSNISSTLPSLSSIDASYANELTNNLIQKSSQFFAANRPDDLISFLNALIQSLKDSFQSQFKIIDELQRNRLNPDSLLKLNELGTSTQNMTSALSDLDDASEIILQASMEPNSEKKFQLSSQALNLIQRSMLKFPEITRILSYSLDQEPSEITYQSIITNIPEDEKQRLEEMKNSTDSEALTTMKSVFSYSIKNEEYTEKQTEITIVKLSVIPPSQLDNLTIYEYIPKSSGISVSDIQSTYNFTILNEDPIIQFSLGSAAIGETKTVVYTINKKLSSYPSQSHSIGLLHAGIPYLPTPEEIVFSDSTHNLRMIAAILITLFILLEFYLTRKSEFREFKLFKREAV